MNRHQIWQAGYSAHAGGESAQNNPYDPSEPDPEIRRIERVQHTVTTVSHAETIGEDAGGGIRYGSTHYHLSCHNAGCDWQPEATLPAETCSQGPAYTEDEAREHSLAHLAETG